MILKFSKFFTGLEITPNSRSYSLLSIKLIFLVFIGIGRFRTAPSPQLHSTTHAAYFLKISGSDSFFCVGNILNKKYICKIWVLSHGLAFHPLGNPASTTMYHEGWF